MLGALFREYIAIFLEKRWEGNHFSFVNKFLDFGAFTTGPYLFYFVTYVGKGIFLDQDIFIVMLFYGVGVVKVGGGLVSFIFFAGFSLFIPEIGLLNLV